MCQLRLLSLCAPSETSSTTGVFFFVFVTFLNEAAHRMGASFRRHSFRLEATALCYPSTRSRGARGKTNLRRRPEKPAQEKMFKYFFIEIIIILLLSYFPNAVESKIKYRNEKFTNSLKYSSSIYTESENTSGRSQQAFWVYFEKVLLWFQESFRKHFNS